MPRAAAIHYRRYLPISDDDRAWGLYVTCGGYLRVPPGASYPLPGHPARYSLGWERGRTLDEFQLHLISRGAGTFESDDGQPRAIAPGAVFLLFPGAWHRYRPDPAQGWDEWWIGFDGEQARRIMRAPFFSAERPLIAAGAHDDLTEHFTAILAILRDDRPHMQRLLAGLTGMLLASLQARVAAGGVDRHGTRAVQQAKRLIAEAVARPVDGHVLADAIGVGYHWLRRAFRQQTGLSLHDYHTQLRIHAAMQRLEQGDASVADIARQLGFDDPYYFSRVFRRQAGLSPQRWQRQRRGE
ncbi:MAG TPA: AraC family transcriptional regulator [Planctomycetota bacterium]|nr:AraC family transcriptional regulator [Planctomycetota bacterium]